MKYAGWIAGLAMLISLFGALEVIHRLKGNEVSVEIAGACILLVWLFLAWHLAKWADQEHSKAREQETTDGDL